jgi:TnpA family transposase
MKKSFKKTKQQTYLSHLTHECSDEELARDWTLSPQDKKQIVQYHKQYRLHFAIQLCALRLYGRFIANVHSLSPRLINYITAQLGLPPTLQVIVPTREATLYEQRKHILAYSKFKKYSSKADATLEKWILGKIKEKWMPKEIIEQAAQYLLNQKIMLPAVSELKRKVTTLYTKQQQNLFYLVYFQLTDEIKLALNQFINTSDKEKRSFFGIVKEFPPYASTAALNRYLEYYEKICKINLSNIDLSMLSNKLVIYCYQLANQYHADDMKRFAEPKRYTLLICFIIETRKILLDYVIALHDQFVSDMMRRSKNSFDEKFKEYRQRLKQANDIMLKTVEFIMSHAENKPITMSQVYGCINERHLKSAVEDCYIYKRLEERGFADTLCTRYSTLRRYFSRFIQLPFQNEHGNQSLLKAIEIIRSLDQGNLKKIPKNTNIKFVLSELQSVLKANDIINRNSFEIGVAIAIKDALRSGDLYLPESKKHVSFWNLVYGESEWNSKKEQAYRNLKLPKSNDAIQFIKEQFYAETHQAQKRFGFDPFAIIENGQLKLTKDDALDIPNSIKTLQQTIDANLQKIRIEQLLMEVDRETGFTQCFTPLPGHHTKPKLFYKTLIAAIIALSTNLGVVAMANSTDGITVDMLRHVIDYYIREETLQAANMRIVDCHHQFPLSSVYGRGSISSSDGQRFGITASSLISAYYPRYFGYYDKAVGIYTHVSDQYSVFSTKVISCSPREALYVLDGLLENNTILNVTEHTTDTAGFTEHIFALCYLLGFYFMPRIRDLKDQQLYRLDTKDHMGDFNVLIRKTVNLNLIEEQWDQMVRVTASLKERLTPAHVIVQRLSQHSPSDRLAKAFTALGRIIKTQYILRYLTDSELRRRVQMQLNRGEYRHKLSRWIFFANQGEFQTGDYEEIMNKASCLSLVSNSVLYWNTPRIGNIIDAIRKQDTLVEDETIARISPLPFKHVIPNGAYFINK